MTHTKFKQLLCLSVCDELTDDEQSRLEAHLAQCAECRTEMREMLQLQSLMTQTPVTVTDELLAEARAQLHRALVQMPRRQPWTERVREFIMPRVVPEYRMAFGGIAMAAFGLFIGYLLFAPAGRNIPADPPGQSAAGSAEPGLEPERSVDPKTAFAGNDARALDALPDVSKGATRTANVRIIHADPRTGAVEFEFDAVSPMHVSGNVNDENVQKILVRTLNEEQNAGVRLKAVGMILSRPATNAAIEPAMKAALIAAMKRDENPAVRQSALTALQTQPQDAEIQKALAYVLLNDKNSGVRIAAINALAGARVDGQDLDKSVRSVLKQKVQYDPNLFIRNQSRNILQEGSQS